MNVTKIVLFCHKLVVLFSKTKAHFMYWSESESDFLPEAQKAPPDSGPAGQRKSGVCSGGKNDVCSGQEVGRRTPEEQPVVRVLLTDLLQPGMI